MLRSAAEGAKSKGADVKPVNLYDYTFQGCVSCLACKLKKNMENGLCVIKDSITSLLSEMAEADVIIFGSPIYFGDVTSQTRAVIERFAYPFFNYDTNHSSKYKGSMKTAFIYTMNINEENMTARNYQHIFENNKMYMNRIFGHSEYLTACDTLIMEDFSRHNMTMFDLEAKKKTKQDQFPEDLEKAFELGAGLCS